jgi:hypothetical protein
MVSTNSAISVKGTAIWASTAPMMAVSVRPPITPANRPSVPPISRPSVAPSTASISVSRRP